MQIQIRGLAGKINQVKYKRITSHFIGNDPENTEALRVPDSKRLWLKAWVKQG